MGAEIDAAEAADAAAERPALEAGEEEEGPAPAVALCCARLAAVNAAAVAAIDEGSSEGGSELS